MQLTLSKSNLQIKDSELLLFTHNLRNRRQLTRDLRDRSGCHYMSINVELNIQKLQNRKGKNSSATTVYCKMLIRLDYSVNARPGFS